MMGSMIRWSVAVTIGLATAAGAQVLPTTPLGYALFGLEGVRIGGFSRIQGDVGTNEGLAMVRAGGRIDGDLAGDTLVIRSGGRAASYFCIQVQGGGRKNCQRLPDPLVDGTTLPVVQVSPGNESITLRRRARRVPLDAGRYRDIRIGTGAELLLAGGAYSFRSIEVGVRARLVCTAPCQVAVRSTVSIGRRGRITLLAGDGGDGSLQVQGGRRDAFTAAGGVTVAALVYAPTADVVFGPRARVTGSLVGRTVAVGARSRVARGDG
jgi:hypothetical protein